LVIGGTCTAYTHLTYKNNALLIGDMVLESTLPDQGYTKVVSKSKRCIRKRV
jgi:hypothetical protein